MKTDNDYYKNTPYFVSLKAQLKERFCTENQLTFKFDKHLVKTYLKEELCKILNFEKNARKEELAPILLVSRPKDLKEIEIFTRCKDVYEFDASSQKTIKKIFFARFKIDEIIELFENELVRARANIIYSILLDLLEWKQGDPIETISYPIGFFEKVTLSKSQVNRINQEMDKVKKENVELKLIQARMLDDIHTLKTSLNDKNKPNRIDFNRKL